MDLDPQRNIGEGLTVEMRIMKKIKTSLGKIENWLRMSWYLFFYEKDVLKSAWILIDSKNGKDLGSNMLRIAEVLANDFAYKRYRLFISCSRDKRADIRAMMERYGLGRARLIRENGFRYARVAALARYLFTDTSFPLWFAKKDGQIITNTWHGTPLKMMGKDEKDRAFDMGNVQKSHLMADYLIYPSVYMKERMASAYFLDDLYKGKILYAGYPRNAVFSEPERGKMLRGDLGLESKKLYSYMPTWRGALRHIDIQENTDRVVGFLADLDKGLAEDEILFVRLHPFIGDTVSFSGYSHIRPFPGGYDPYDILNMCDCLVTDYSSVLFDYADTGRKVILFVYDKEAYMEERGMYVPIDTFPFPQVRQVDALLAELRTPKQYDDCAFRERFCPYDRKGVARDICRHIIQGENVFEEYEAEKNGRENVLIYSGSLKRNGMTTALLDLFKKIDLDKRNYYVTFRSQDLKEEPERVGLLPEDVGFYPIASTRNESLGEGIAAYLYYKKDVAAPLIMRKLDRYYRRLYRSSFGFSDFSCVIQYAGYGKGIINLFYQAPCRRVIFVHNDMVRELETKDNQHRLTLQRAYGGFERVAPVTEDICPPTRELGGTGARIQVVNNCHDYEGIHERADRELIFDEDTECTVSRERLREILDGSGKRFITIGRFSPEKGHGMLLEAFERYHEKEPESFLIIIGGYGELYAQTLSQAKALACGSHVVVIRSISNPMPILKKCDLFVLSSFYEGLPLVLSEADMLGIPAIATDIPGPRCFMKRYGGYLVPPDVDGILDGFLAFDRGEVKVMGVDHEAWDRTAVQQFEALFSERGEQREERALAREPR